MQEQPDSQAFAETCPLDPMDPRNAAVPAVADSKLEPHGAASAAAAAAGAGRDVLAPWDANMSRPDGIGRVKRHVPAITPAGEKENVPEAAQPASSVFRLAAPAEARLEGNRVALKRGAFLKKRSEGGPRWLGAEAAGGL